MVGSWTMFIYINEKTKRQLKINSFVPSTNHVRPRKEKQNTAMKHGKFQNRKKTT